MKNFLLFHVLFLSFHLGFSQNQPPVQINSFPPSPNAASLGKFVDIPVGHYTGTPNISVPIWTVKEGDIEVPVSLNYHAGGIQVAEIASWVGLGWALNAGGVITRTMRGRPDDGDRGFMATFNKIPTSIVQQPLSFTEQGKYMEWANGYHDTQPDQFTFSFGAKSGKFQFDQEGNIYIAPYQKINIKPFFSVGKSNIYKWEVITEDGFKYIFDKKEVATSTNACVPLSGGEETPSFTSSWYLSVIKSPSGNQIHFHYDQVPAYSYRLGDIQTTYHKVGSYGSAMPPIVTCTTTTNITESVRLSRISCSSGSIHFKAETNRADLPGDKRLDSIIIKDYNSTNIKKFILHYQYMYGTSLIESTGSLSPESCRLALLMVTEKAGIGTASKPPHIFEYELGLPERTSYAVDHWGYFNGIYNNDYKKRIVPRAIHINDILDGADRDAYDAGIAGIIKSITYPTGGKTVFTYEANETDRGTYFFKDTTVRIKPFANSNGGTLTQKLSAMCTIGNYEGGSNIEITLHRGTFPDLCTKGGCQCGVQALLKRYHVVADPIIDSDLGCTARTSDQHADLTDISKMVPSGVSYILELIPKNGSFTSSRYFDVSVSWREPKERRFRGGGFRIKQVDDYADGKLVKSRSYEYLSDNGKSSGRTLKVPAYTHLYKQEEVIGGNYQTAEYLVRTSTPNSPLNTTQGSPVGYGQVTEFINDVSTGTPVKGALGKTVRKFTTIEIPFYFNEDYHKPAAFPFAPANYFDWIGGSLTEETHYRRNGDNYYKVKQKINVYKNYLKDDESPNVRTCLGVKIAYQKRSNQSNLHSYLGKYFTFTTAYSELKSTTDSIFDQDNPKRSTGKTTYYTYSQDHLQPVKVETTQSDGSVNGVINTYPTDYGTSYQNENFIDDLKYNHIINKPIETVIYKADPETNTQNRTEGINRRITGGITMTYKRGDTGLPDSVYVFEAANSVPETSFRYSNRSFSGITYQEGTPSSFSLNRVHYKKRGCYDLYDSKGNILQYTMDDMITSVIWSQAVNKPVMKVENATISIDVTNTSKIAYNGFESGTDGGQNGWSIDKGSLVSRTHEPDHVLAGNFACKTNSASAASISYVGIFNLNPPVPQEGKYKLGMWVKTPSGYISGQVFLNMHTIRKNNCCIVYPSNAHIRIPVADTKGKWQYVEAMMDFDKLKGSLTTELSIRCYLESQSAVPVYLDEVRIFPADASPTTWTYDGEGNVTSVITPDNKVTIYEYDALGRLQLIRDKDRNITSSQHYRYAAE